MRHRADRRAGSVWLAWVYQGTSKHLESPLTTSHQGHLRVHGLAPESRHHYLRYARRLIHSLQMSEPDWTALNAQQIRDFICCEAGKRKTGSCRLVIAAIRAFLRFLAAEGVVPPNLHRAVPVVREWRHASLPQHISTEELERVLQICRTPTAGCSRDACIILMMARLGMRAGEVRQLNLNDIDWIEGEIHVRAGKSRRERTLPLFRGGRESSGRLSAPRTTRKR